MLGFGFGWQRKERLGLAVQSVNHILRDAVAANGHKPHFPVGGAKVLDELVALGRCALGEMAQVERRDACDKVEVGEAGRRVLHVSKVEKVGSMWGQGVLKDLVERLAMGRPCEFA